MKPLCLLLTLAGAGLACLHPPRTYPGNLGSKVQEWLVYRNGPEIHLVTNQIVRSDSSLPDELAWVLPLPTVPVEYREESDSLFQWLFHATRKPSARARQKGSPALAAKGMIVHPKVFVGKYEIRPLEIVDTASGKEMNDWLSANGFARVPIAGLRYYLRPKSCFLAVKVKGLRGNEETLKPLHIVYPASKASVPLKFFANAGVFDAFIYAIRPRPDSSKGIGSTGPDLRSFGFVLEGMDEVTDAMRKRWDLAGLPAGEMDVLRYSGDRLNREGFRIGAWKNDPEILGE